MLQINKHRSSLYAQKHWCTSIIGGSFSLRAGRSVVASVRCLGSRHLLDRLDSSACSLSIYSSPPVDDAAHLAPLPGRRLKRGDVPVASQDQTPGAASRARDVLSAAGELGSLYPSRGTQSIRQTLRCKSTFCAFANDDDAPPVGALGVFGCGSEKGRTVREWVGLPA